MFLSGVYTGGGGATNSSSVGKTLTYKKCPYWDRCLLGTCTTGSTEPDQLPTARQSSPAPPRGRHVTRSCSARSYSRRCGAGALVTSRHTGLEGDLSDPGCIC